MNYDILFKSDRKVEVAVIGVSGFNHSLFTYGFRGEKIHIRIVCGRNIQKCRDAYHSVGIPDEKIQHCSSYEEGIEAHRKGKYLIFNDVEIAMRMPFDVVVEGTGNPEASAVHVLSAIENKKHIVMVTKESDSVAGSIIARKAKQNGVIYSLAEGDQPSLLVGLVSWARTAGLKVLSIGKSSEYDFIYNEEKGEITVLDQTLSVPELRDYWRFGKDIKGTLEKRSELLSMFNQRNIPDYAEMGIVCNHLPEFHPDIPRLHVPIAKTLEIPDVMCSREYGGIFNGDLRIDVVNCLRRPDEQSLEGGEWVVVACDDEETWNVLRDKGVPLSRNEKTAMIYYPAHYLGFESIFSVLSAGLLGMPTGSPEPRPRYDLVARTSKPLKKGTRFEARGHHHIIDGLEGMLLPAEPISQGKQLPYFLSDSTILKEDVEAGTLITSEMLEWSEDAVLWKLRKEQDIAFFSE